MARLSGIVLLGAAVLACEGRDAYLGDARNDTRCEERCFVDPGLPADARARFVGRPLRVAAPEIVYPLAGSVHPLSLPELTLQWRRGDASLELYRVRFTTAGAPRVYELYVPCLAAGVDGCRYSVPDALWDGIRREFAGARVAVEVTGADASGRGATSRAVEFSFTRTAVQDQGFYFWSATPEFSGTFRLVLGARRAVPFVGPRSPTDERVACVGCHAVSRDGTTIAYTVRGAADPADDQRTGHLVVSTTARPDQLLVMPSERYDSSMLALTNDGRRVLVAFDNRLVLRTTSADPELGLPAGGVVGEVPASILGPNAHGYFPEFSRTNDWIALTVSTEPDSPHAVRSGSIAILGYDGASGGFGPLRVVVPETDVEFHYYPTWSPDGRYLAFVSAPRAPGATSYDQRWSRLRLVRLEDGAVVELARATAAAGSWSTLPKFASFDPEQNDGLFFLTFNTKIDYGLLLRNSEIDDPRFKVPQLWLSALDPARFSEDPSSAPVWLPFQDFTQRSHLGFWTERVLCRLDVPREARCAPDQPSVECQNGLCLTVPR